MCMVCLKEPKHPTHLGCCKHMFCFHCIMSWIVNRPELADFPCPSCSGKISEFSVEGREFNSKSVIYMADAYLHLFDRHGPEDFPTENAVIDEIQQDWNYERKGLKVLSSYNRRVYKRGYVLPYVKELCWFIHKEYSWLQTFQAKAGDD